MRVRRIAIRNYRGVDACEVTLPPTGVTIIEGPNEVGKSSLAEAVDLLFDYPHDSRHRHLQAVRPVHRDVGTEVEVELTTGPYQVVYRKRWFRQPETHLRVLAPRAESLTARQAHERMEQILEETLDRDLYRALRCVQGGRAEPGPVGTSTSLVRALDRAAAGGLADPEAESTLWEAVEQERARYFTATGRVSQEREARAAAVASAEERVTGTRAALDELEGLGDRYRETVAQATAKAAQEAEASAELAAAERAGDALEAADHNLLERTAEQERAERLEANARHLDQDRRALVANVEEASAELAGLADRLAAVEPVHAAAVVAAERAEAAHQQAEGLRVAALAAVELADRDREFRRAEVSSGLLATRLERVAEARAAAIEARRVLDGSAVDSRHRSSVEGAVRRVAEARAARRAGSPVVEVEALDDIELTVEGERAPLASGDRRLVVVDGVSVLAIGRQAVVRVRGGTSTADLATEVAAAEHDLGTLVEQLGLHAGDPLGSLALALDARRDAEQQLEQATRARAEALGDLTEEALAAKAACAGDLVAHYRGQRPPSPPLPATAEAADEARRVAVDTLRAAETAEGDRRHALAGCQQEAQASAVKRETLRELQRLQQERHGLAGARLATARAERSDADLADDLVAAGEATDKARAATAAAVAHRQALDPDATHLRLHNARGCVERVGRERQELEDRRIELRTALREKGQADLQAELDSAVADLVRLRAEHDDLERRAAAAKRLHDAFARHRDAARLAYVAPYKHQIERLARLVFGPDTAVDVDPQDFAVTTRTRDGVTVPVESLSTGAREQLAVLSRLACAILVNADGADGDAGAPVVLDDALGCTDPDRLRRVAPAFAAAAEQAQVIVLTSQPDSYGRIGDATVIRLPVAPGGDGGLG